MKSFAISLLLLLFVGCNSRQDYVRLSEEVVPKTVSIHVKAIIQVTKIIIDKDGFHVSRATETVSFTGSGVYVSENGHVLSCNHLFEAREILSTSVCDYRGVCEDADVLYREEDLDLSLLKIPAYTPYALIADPRDTKVGQEVIAVGTPLGLDGTVTHGMISAVHRDLDEAGAYNLVQIDTPINPGNSGGPLFNMKGQIVGINILKAPNYDGIGFSVDSGQIIEFLTRYIRKQEPLKLPKSW